MEENDFLKEELLRRAVKQMCEEAYEKEAETPPHTFSETFEREMETLLESREKPGRRKGKKYRVLLQMCIRDRHETDTIIRAVVNLGHCAGILEAGKLELDGKRAGRFYEGLYQAGCYHF